MSDTGRVPGEGLPENAGTVEQPGVPAPDSYTYLEPSAHTPEDDDLLLMPSAQGAWGEPQPAAQPTDHYADPAAQGGYQPHFHPQPADPAHAQGPVQLQEQAPAYAMHQAAPAPLPETAPGTHESGGRDSGSVDLGAVRVPAPAAQPSVRRPLHRGPASPEPSYGGTSGAGVVRSLADRGPAGAPPARHAGPATAEPEYFDPQPADQPLPGPQLGAIPPQAAQPWAPVAPEAPAAPEQTAPEPPVQPVAPAVEAQAADAVAPEAPAPVAEQPAMEPAPVAAPGPGAVAAPVAAPEPGGVAEPVAAPEPVAVAEPVPAAEPEPVAAVVEPAQAAAPEPVAVVEPEPAPVPVAVAEPESAPVAEAAPVPAPEPVPAAAPEPVAVAEPEPVAVPEPVPAPEPEPAQVAAPEPTPAPEPHPAPAPEPHPVAAPEPAPQPQPEAVAEPAPAPEPQPEAVAVAEAVPAVEPEAVPAGEQSIQPEAAAPEPAPEVIETPDLSDETDPVQADPVQAEPAPAEPVQQEAPGEAPAAPPAPGYDDAEREAVLRVMRERRDIRNGFRSDPIPHEVLLRVLEAAHTAPSVGHSQPWDFVVIRSAETRRSMHELAQQQREAYAKSLPKARAKQFKELKIEAILETPVNIVVTADPTRGGRHTLGRHTQPQMAPYSSALAVENLWLAARAEGLGVGWVSFFDEREMVRALGLPEHLEIVAYLCVGYVDEFPEDPELMQAGWSKRRPLSWVVHEETYGRRALPGEAPHDLLQETISNIRPLDAKALGEAWERQKRMTKPAGALGMLEIISAQLAGLSRMCPPPIPEPAAVAVFAGDHGVHAQGVTAWPQEVTGQMIANMLGGGAVCNAFAAQVGAEVCVVDVGAVAELPAMPGLLPRKVRAGTADFTTGPALTREEVHAAIEVGIETARDLVAAGNKGLLTGEMGIANTTASAALICVYTGMDPAEVTGRGTGINDEMHARKIDVVRRALELHQPDPADPIGVLAAVGGLEHAAMAGFLLGGASLRTPVILDGVSAGAAALVARAIAPEALAACIAGHRSAEPGHVAALNKLGLRPLVDLDLRLGEGTGALLALPIVQSAARAMHEVATFDSAGVTEK
ncbi:nicotinate-nucleotide--dimethylbenzimidazole phosphoribosyltransferase [Streptomyces sp. 130]|uniref:nicotinate-nucleotide--dimethylbenzimidazole phosphoribosyltransferase n=1 Tax=Streptomyces sp. 130 TaxID=2591006 RepID=UPI00117CAEB4|nr:nicotinate-nucleotide--dimethylbenzimidazole phosphoribosyltransferase [Streptomyces sp. 130]TRV71583.1 nicotinate-nucleotide--dimethylbenzimidazole phosphoribosyltransferase [Streptomyces sp. 130]